MKIANRTEVENRRYFGSVGYEMCLSSAANYFHYNKVDEMIIAITVIGQKMNFPDRGKLEFLLPRGRSQRASIFESLSRSGCIFSAITDIFFCATFSLIGVIFMKYCQI